MEIRVEAHGPQVAVVTIDNQPRRNAMTRQMMAELAAQWPARALDLDRWHDRLLSSAARAVRSAHSSGHRLHLVRTLRPMIDRTTVVALHVGDLISGVGPAGAEWRRARRVP